MCHGLRACSCLCARAQRERLRISDVLRLAAGLLDNVGKLSELPNMDLPGEPSYV